MSDILIHSLIAIILVILCYLFEIVGIVLAVTFFYWWELSQRIARDSEHKGLLYWFLVARWGDTSKREALIPVSLAVVTLVTLFVVGI